MCAPLQSKSIIFMQLLAKILPSNRLVHLTLRLAPLGNPGSATALSGVLCNGLTKWGSRPPLFCEHKSAT